MFYITGDVHADLKDLESRDFGRLKKDDMVVICGDFGILWTGDKAEQKNIRMLGRQKCHTLFVDGTHENFDLLDQYPVTEWNGGRVQVLEGNLIHLMRGEVYTIAGKKIFTFGGGESTDQEIRTPHGTWWPQEMPGEEEMRRGIANLVKADWQVDYIFTHEAPVTFKDFMEENEMSLNALNIYLDYIREKCSFKKWIFGHYHRDKRVAPNCEAVFGGVVCLE